MRIAILDPAAGISGDMTLGALRSEEHTSELQSRSDLVCRLLLEKKKKLRLHSPYLRATARAVRLPYLAHLGRNARADHKRGGNVPLDVLGDAVLEGWTGAGAGAR